MFVADCHRPSHGLFLAAIVILQSNVTTNKLNILFLCSRNQWRSPTCETLYRNDPRLSVRSAGVKRGARRYVTENDIRWANTIFVMELEHKRIVVERFRKLELPSIIVLDIPDEYEYMDPQLQTLIHEAVNPIIELFFSQRQAGL